MTFDVMPPALIESLIENHLKAIHFIFND